MARHGDFLGFRGPVHATSLLEPILAAVRPQTGEPLGAFIPRVAGYIRGHFEYAPAVG